MKSKSKVGIISGYFNPIHYGHIEYITHAKARCNILVAIINNDKQVEIKGSKKFMDEDHRRKIVMSIKGVTDAIVAIDDGPTVCETIKEIRNMYRGFDMVFFNSGDRKGPNQVSDEIVLCEELGIDYQFIDEPKIFSSSEILKNK